MGARPRRTFTFLNGHANAVFACPEPSLALLGPYSEPYSKARGRGKMPRLKLDEASVRAAVLSAGKRQALHWDTKTPGLGLLVGPAVKTFVYQRDLPGGLTRRLTLG